MVGIFTWASMGLAACAASLAAVIGAAMALERWRQARDRRRLAPPGRLVDVGGRRLHIHCRGADRPGPTVVMEAGGGNPALYGNPVAERVAQFARVCVYDRAGLGWSDPDPRPRDFAAIAADLDRLLQEAQIPGPYILEGASFGGLAVRAYADAYPEKVAGMVLTDAAEEQVVFGAFDAFMRNATRAFRKARIAAALGVVRWLMVRRPEAVGLPTGAMSRDDVEAAAALLSRDSYWTAARLEATAYDLTPPSMRKPGGFGGLGGRPLVVLAHGRPMGRPHEQLEAGWRAGQERLAGLSTRGELRIVEDAGHAISLERPDAVAGAIRDVFDRVRARERRVAAA
jgi:pimeloyl-ACP methyl ester carboxylesterase